MLILLLLWTCGPRGSAVRQIHSRRAGESHGSAESVSRVGRTLCQDWGCWIGVPSLRHLSDHPAQVVAPLPGEWRGWAGERSRRSSIRLLGEAVEARFDGSRERIRIVGTARISVYGSGSSSQPEAAFEENGELGFRHAPLPWRHLPLFLHLPQD
jgi:hypothetical protein